MKDSADAMPTFYDIDSHTPEVSGSDTSKTEAPSFDMSFSPLNSLQKVTRFYYLVWAVIGCILLALGAWYLLKQMTTALAVICFAALLVFLLRSPVDWMEAKGIPRWAGALIAYFVGLTGVTLIGLIVIPILMKQLVDLISQVPAYIGNLEDVYEHFIERYGYILEDSNINQIVHSLGETVTTWAISFVSSAPGGAISIGTNLINAALVFLISLVAGYWVLKDLPTIKLEAKALIKPSHRDDLSFVALAFSRALGGYLRGMLIAGTCVSIFTFIGFSILKMPYSALLALIAGLMMFIPILGPWISGVTVVSIGLFVS
ncbi:MAG: AI-2E family transporter, partial [Coriobacteriia bacterium]|nr:AI-2E family transporter [Coriobacteriia bacterium]